jgi:hypothetical protein
MSATSTVATHLLWPEILPIDDLDRRIARDSVRTAYQRNDVDAETYAAALNRIDGAANRGHLTTALRGVPVTPYPPAGLFVALRLFTGLTLVSTAVQIVVWLLIGLIGGWDAPWWLWSAIPSAFVVFCLWCATEGPRRAARSQYRIALARR